MERKSVALQIKSADDQTGTFTGLASVFDNVDYDGDIVRRGAFSKSLGSGTPIPLIWMHKADDPRNYVGDVVEAAETDEGLAIKGRFDHHRIGGQHVTHAGSLADGGHDRHTEQPTAGRVVGQAQVLDRVCGRQRQLHAFPGVFGRRVRLDR